MEYYTDWDSTSGLMLLREAPLPQDILKIGAGGINQIWRDAKVRAAGIKRAQTLVEAAQNSVGLEAGEAARLEIWVLVNDYILKAEQLKRLDEYLEEKIKEARHRLALYIQSMKGLSPLDKLNQGYSFVEKDGKAVTSVLDIKEGDLLTICVADGKIKARAEKTAEVSWAET